MHHLSSPFCQKAQWKISCARHDTILRLLLCITRCAFRPTLLLERNESYILKVQAMFADMQYLCCTDLYNEAGRVHCM